MHKVSILIPCYNAEKWIADTLESATGQTWHNKEIIVVDDGSTDSSLAIARQFENRDVKIISQQNQGASVARNTAYKESQGDFIQYLDADDLLAPSKLEKQILALSDQPKSWLSVSSIIHFEDGCPPESGILDEGWPMQDTSDPVEWLIDLYGGNGRGGMIQTGQWLTPRQVAESAGPWDRDKSPDDDGEYFCRVVLASHGISYVKESKTYYRKFKSELNLAAAGSRSEKYQRAALRSLDLKVKHLLGRTADPRAKRALARSYMERAVMAYPYYPNVTEIALKRVEGLGGTTYRPAGGTWRYRLIERLFGWKIARKANVIFHQCLSRRRALSPIKKMRKQ